MMSGYDLNQMKTQAVNLFISRDHLLHSKQAL
jgi:hypothetical protein